MTLDLDAALALRAVVVAAEVGSPVRVGVVGGSEGRHRDDLVAALGLSRADVLDVEVWDDAQFEAAVLSEYRDEIVDRATLGLWRTNPDNSARQVFRGWQVPAGLLAAVAIAALLIVRPQDLLIGLSVAVGVGFLMGVVFKFWTSLRGARMEDVSRLWSQPAAEPDDRDLPRYTVLVPVYREANIVARLMENLGALDYPVDRLEVLVLVEEDDDETRQAVLGAHPPAHVRVVVVPDGQPRTKPRACNVGLLLATGDMLVIYDAEDRPEPDQLKKAVAAFRRGSRRLVCVQAALNYFNADQNILTRMFTLEYSYWFDYMLPGLEYGTLPIPLGGTSNHFRTDRLRELRGWDPFNVTEDADLGIRAAAQGMTVGVIGSTTFEEANSQYANFVRQRSRWIKGYMQTTLVHLRHPVQLVRVAGLRQMLSVIFLVAGTPVTFLAVPPLYAVFIASVLLGPGEMSVLFPGWALWLALFNLGVGSSLMIYVSMMGAFKRSQFELVPWALLNPLYWVLHALAAYKALWQLFIRPHYWEKTDHGLAGTDAAGTTRASAVASSAG